MTEPKIDLDTQLRFLAIHQQHITDDFNFHKRMLRYHENELVQIWLGLFALSVVIGAMAYKIHKLERKFNAPE